MSDDELTAEQLYHLRQEAQRGEITGDDEQVNSTTATYRPDKAEVDALVAASKEGIDVVAESTEMISRDDLFRNAARDRALRRGSKETVRVDSVTIPLRDGEAADQTVEFASVQQEDIQSLDATMESNAYQRQDPPREQQGTSRFSRIELPEADEIEFPVRLLEDGAIIVPREVVDEFDLDAGDLLIVTLRKVRG